MIPRRAPCRGEGGFRGAGAPQDRSQPLAATLFRRVAGGKAPSVGSPKISLSVSSVHSVVNHKHHLASLLRRDEHSLAIDYRLADRTGDQS